MAKRQQVWIGSGLGVLGLLALFGVLYLGSARGGIALDGEHLASGAGPAVEAGDGSDVLGSVTTSDDNGDVRSFAADGGSLGRDGSSGVALRVVIDGASPEAAASDAATDSPSLPSNNSTGGPATSTTAAPPSSTSAPSSSTVPTTAALSTNAPTAANASKASTTEATPAKDSSSSSPSTAAAVATSSTTRPPSSASDSSSGARGFEQEVIRLTNEERAAGGCGPLTSNSKLHTAALGHSVDMADNNFFSHTGGDGSSMVDRIERQGYEWRSLAENIAAGYRSPAAVVDGWMNSSGHRDNIMNCNLTEIGVGFHDNYWTQNFGTPR